MHSVHIVDGQQLLIQRLIFVKGGVIHLQSRFIRCSRGPGRPLKDILYPGSPLNIMLAIIRGVLMLEFMLHKLRHDGALSQL